MKKVSVLCLIAILGFVLWALPAGAEKIRLTDAELDGITAGKVATGTFTFTIPPPTSIECCVRLGAVGMGVAVTPPPSTLATGSLSLATFVPIGMSDGAGVNVGLIGSLQKPPGVMIGQIFGSAAGPKGAVVPLTFLFIFP